MYFAIEQLVLWPVRRHFAPRTLVFEPGKVNVVSGPSGTGKSAILAIVDYVLGSGKCAIPVGPIRDTVEWYGLVVDLGHTKMVVARHGPGRTRVSSDYYFQLSESPEVPSFPERSASWPAFKHVMDRLAGLTNLDFDADRTGNGFLGRPSFRDMAAFNLLPQYIVANPSALFFKADTMEHRRKLATIFPFVLGAVTVEDLEAEYELAEITRQQRRVESEHAQRMKATEIWKSEAFGLYSRAQELGLVSGDLGQPSSLAECIDHLSMIPERVVATIPMPEPGATATAALSLQALREREAAVASDLSDLRRRITRIEGLRNAMRGLDSAVEYSVGRVKGIGWFADLIGDTSTCVLCGLSHRGASERLESLKRSAHDLAQHQRAARAAPVMLQREMSDLTAGAAELEAELRYLRREMSEMLEPSEQRGGQRLEQVYRFVGRLEQSIANFSVVERDGGSGDQLSELSANIAILRKKLDAEGRRRRLESALRLVSTRITIEAGLLDLERANDAISLLPDELTLKFEQPSHGREDYLWEIGSGANWMGYHIATMLGLHHYFISMGRSVVPSFLMVDQPSQVYFPSGIPDGPLGNDRDIHATRRVFEVLSKGVREAGYQLQVIVVDHADDRTLTGVAGLHFVADWHGPDEERLIPAAWMDR